MTGVSAITSQIGRPSCCRRHANVTGDIATYDQQAGGYGQGVVRAACKMTADGQEAPTEGGRWAMPARPLAVSAAPAPGPAT